MNRYPVFFRWLVWAALIDWSVGRALTRSAIFMPKSPPVILIYQGLGILSQLAATASGLLILVALAWLAWVYLHTGKSLVLPFALANLILLNLLFLLIPPADGMAVGYYLFLILAIGSLGWQSLQAHVEIGKRIAAMLVALALLASAFYLLISAWFGWLGLSGPPGYSERIFNLGELLVLFAAVSLGWAYGRPASRSAWLLSAIPALAFTALHLVNPAIASVIGIWSTGLSLYLPWPIYTLGLWLAALAVFGSFERRDPGGWAILLLAAGGYTPQLSSQAFLGIAALALLVPLAAGSTERIRLQAERGVQNNKEFQHPV